MDRIREFLIWMKPHRIVKQGCRLNVHFNYSVDRSYMEMQQYTETLHSRMNQLQDERDDLLSRVESIERENRALKEEMEEAKSQLEDSKKTREDLQTRVDEVLASQEKYKRLAENINGMEEDMTKIKAEFPLF